jgi:hypothetical protein
LALVPPALEVKHRCIRFEDTKEGAQLRAIGTTAALQAPDGATAKQAMPPGEMLRVGMGALVALSGLAVMETLQVTTVV